MTTATETRFVKCWSGHVGEHGVIPRGQVVRADHPAALQHPSLFLPSDTPESEMPSVFSALEERRHAAEMAEREERQRRLLEAAKRNKVKLPEPDLTVCVQDHAATFAGAPAWIQKGSVVLADDPVVLASPESWRAK